MKKVAIFLGFLFISLGAFAQKRSDFQGPKYKNYKPWKHKTKSTVVYINKDKKNLKGPKYKNYKPWRDTTNEDKKVLNVNLSADKPKLTGPKYKNYKPWRNKAK